MNYVNITKIKPDSNQPRKTFENLDELAESLKNDGFLYPIIVDSDNTIIDGERRYRAAKLANIELVPVIEVNVNNEEQRLVKQLIADTHHQKLPVLERDKAWKKLYDELGGKDGITLTEFAKVINAPETKVQNWNARVNLDFVYDKLDKQVSESEKLKGYIIDETRPLKDEPEVRAKVIKKIHDDNIRSRDGLRTFVRDVKDATPEQREEMLTTKQDKYMTSYHYVVGAIRVLENNLNDELWTNLPDGYRIKLSGSIHGLRRHLARWKAFDNEVLDEGL